MLNLVPSSKLATSMVSLPGSERDVAVTTPNRGEQLVTCEVDIAADPVHGDPLRKTEVSAEQCLHPLRDVVEPLSNSWCFLSTLPSIPALRIILFVVSDQ